MSDAFINARDVIKTYRSKSGRVHALDGLSPTVPQGSARTIPGSNGEGRTTTVKVLTTLVRPDSRDARIAGIDIVKHPRQLPRQSVCQVSAHPSRGTSPRSRI